MIMMRILAFLGAVVIDNANQLVPVGRTCSSMRFLNDGLSVFFTALVRFILHDRIQDGAETTTHFAVGS